MDPNENPIPYWMKYDAKGNKVEVKPEEPLDPVQQFKNNPDSFFPDFTKQKQG
jgi:hypothetical protein